MSKTVFLSMVTGELGPLRLRLACYLAEEQTAQTEHIALLREHEVYAKSPEG